ncbi:MAG: hypothetical protein DRQ51_10495 [Gammaproteobacteria bacterium]|nr:MAG: hypothetical protein DRQ51_10495 [Gammaproteobacteria bacterium]
MKNSFIMIVVVGFLLGANMGLAQKFKPGGAVAVPPANIPVPVKNVPIPVPVSPPTQKAVNKSAVFVFKEVKDFLPLSKFKNINEFENNFKKYVDDCIDKKMSVRCFISYEMWDRELNIYYKKLRAKLDKNGKKLLKTSQKSWLKYRDESFKFNSSLLDARYNDGGADDRLRRAEESDSMASFIVKSQTLLLKKYFTDITNN